MFILKVKCVIEKAKLKTGAELGQGHETNTYMRIAIDPVYTDKA